MGKFIDYKVNSGFYNMEYDENLLENSIKNSEKFPILRLYGWSPACISLGRNQREDSVDYSLCKELGIDVVRRATGGRALLHDKELTYSFICPCEFLEAKESVKLSYKEISSSLILAFKELGLNIDFPEEKKVSMQAEYCMSLSTGADLSYKGKKIIGSAQVRKSGYILQHGAILMDIDFELTKKLFHENANSNEITFLKEINDSIKIEELIFAVKKGFEKKFNQKFL